MRTLIYVRMCRMPPAFSVSTISCIAEIICYFRGANIVFNVRYSEKDAHPSTQGFDLYPVRTICRVYSKWFRNSSAVIRQRLVDDVLQKNQTIVAEINRPWAEHLIPIDHLFMECYTIIGPDNLPLPAVSSTEMMRSTMAFFCVLVCSRVKKNKCCSTFVYLFT